MFSFGKEMLKSSPDLFNFISFQINLESEKNLMEIEEENTKNTILYEKHLEEKEMKANIKQGKMFQGKIYFQNNILDNAIVKSNLFDKDIVIEGDKNLNRAMHGDIVCFSLNEEAKWKKDINIKFGDEGDEGIEQEENIQDKEIFSNIINIKEKIAKTNLQPTGYITGILKRNRTIFCGTIYNPTDPINNSICENLSNFMKNYSKKKRINIYTYRFKISKFYITII
jgi:exoribonuclease R